MLIPGLGFVEERLVQFALCATCIFVCYVDRVNIRYNTRARARASTVPASFAPPNAAPLQGKL